MKKLAVITSILLALGVFLGVFHENLKKESEIVKEVDFKIEDFEKNPEKKMRYSIYFPDEKFTKLEVVEEELKYSENKNETVKILVDKTVLKLQEKKMISEDTKLKNVFFREDEIYLNFSSWKERDEKKNLYIIYSITNSLCDALGLKKVKFLIDGEEGKGVFREYYEKNLNI